ncbi:MAG: hypothetical protein U1F57_04290 [bacterium]
MLSFLNDKLLNFLLKGGLLALFCLASPPIKAWNDDYNPDYLPTERTVCVKNLGAAFRDGNASIRSTAPDEPCAENEARFRLVVGTNPKGSFALIPLQNYDKFSPPWVVSWPAGDDWATPRLWHFTCFANTKVDVLGTTSKNRHFRGEITAPSDHQSCESAATMAQQVCSENLGGSEIYEQCSGGFSEP